MDKKIEIMWWWWWWWWWKKNRVKVHPVWEAEL